MKRSAPSASPLSFAGFTDESGFSDARVALGGLIIILPIRYVGRISTDGWTPLDGVMEQLKAFGIRDEDIEIEVGEALHHHLIEAFVLVNEDSSWRGIVVPVGTLRSRDAWDELVAASNAVTTLTTQRKP